jgi:hypothetical protein
LLVVIDVTKTKVILFQHIQLLTDVIQQVLGLAPRLGKNK